MLLTLLYHHVHAPKQGLHVADFSKHLEALCEKYHIVVPGESLKKDKLNVCLTFDDAFFDFYYFVFPLLKKLNIKAILAVPTAFIEEDTTLPTTERLEVEGYDGLHQGKSFAKNPFCTWRELNEMVQSEHVILASHSHNHHDFTKAETDLEFELTTSKSLIVKHTHRVPQLFVYPYGHLNRASEKIVKQHFPIAMRVGHAVNFKWDPLLYRVDAETFWPKTPHMPTHKLLVWVLKHYSNKLRGR